jgi:putative ABC transport system permease protein
MSRPGDRSRDIARELESHLELEADEQRAAGLPPAEARHAARRALGSTALVAEQVRAVWTPPWLDALRRDLRYAVRSLRKNAGFAAVATLTLALGIGATTAIFTIVDALLLRPLPFTDPERLVRLYATRDGARIAGTGMGGPSALDARDYAAAGGVVDRIAIYDVWRKNVSAGAPDAEAQQMRVGLVPADYFRTLDVRPVFGRLFAPDEEREGRNDVAAISTVLWKTRFDSDPRVLGRTLHINDEPYTIVAVMPDVIPEWMEPGRVGRVDVWTPLAFSNWWTEPARGSRGTGTLARLKPGVSVRDAQTALSAVAARLAAEHPVDRGVGVLVMPLADTRVAGLRPMLLLLTAGVGLILLIACANLANLLAARNSTRDREMALRAALGAGRAGLVRQLLVEALVLALGGAALGSLVAHAGLAALASIRYDTLPQLDVINADWRMLAFSVLASLVTCLLFGLAPAVTATRLELVDVLKQGGRSGTAGPAWRRLRHLLVAAEIAMTLMLLVGAGLVVQSILRLQHQSLGIRQDHLLKGHFYLPPVRYPDPSTITAFCDRFADRVRALPGVVDATVTTAYPPRNGWTQMLDMPGRRVASADDVPSAQFGVADTHFFTALGIPILRGRGFEAADAAGAAVAVVSEEFRRRYAADADPIGRTMHIGPPRFLDIAPGANNSDAADVRIVGVAGDFRNAGLAAPAEPHVTVLYAQHPLVNYGFKDIVVRTASDPYAMAPAIARQLHELDAELAFAEVQTVEDSVAEQAGSQRLTAIVLTLFACAGVALAIVGVYGVVSFLVAQRRVELAVRMAVGASGGAVLWLVLRDSLAIAAAGAVVGLAGAAAAQRLTAGLLFGISPLDPRTFAAAAALVLAIAGIATAVPGCRAMRIDPARTLTQD